MSKASVVLLCAAPGTGLSRIAKSLNTTTGIRVWDLEDEFLATVPFKSKKRPPKTARDMFYAVRRPRRELYAGWKDAYTKILSEAADEHTAQARLICMHLTWYNPETREFFSPVNVRHLYSDTCRIEHIIVLVDDIYDMFLRLTEPANLYDDRSMKVLSDGIAKISKVSRDRNSTTDEAVDLTDQELRDLERQKQEARETRRREYRIQAMETALEELISWRRAEMVQAENVARSLDCDLTLLGIKHTKKSLTQLVSNTRIPRVYLSHRITELRRANVESLGEDYTSQPTPAGSWGTVADEVNDLHTLCSDGGQLLINPTAIDELRFQNLAEGRRSPILTPRWPLPSPHNALLCGVLPSAGTPYQHLKLLRDEVTTDNEVASHVARSLSNRIYSEIAFRDHVIVENTPGLCVFRPFYCEDLSDGRSEPKWSGGVGPEITHWLNNYRRSDALNAPPDPARKVAFINSVKELEERISYLTLDPSIRAAQDFRESIRDHIDSTLDEWAIEDDEEYPVLLKEMLQDRHEESHLKIRSLPPFAVEYPEMIVDAVHAAFPMAYYHAFTRMTRQANDMVSLMDSEEAPPNENRSLNEEDQTLREEGPFEDDTMADIIDTVASTSSDVVLFAVEETDTRNVVRLDQLAVQLCEFFAGKLNTLEQNKEFGTLCFKKFEEVTQQGFATFAAATVGVSYSEVCSMSDREQLSAGSL